MHLILWTDARTDAGRKSGSYYSGNGSEVYAARLDASGALLDAVPIPVAQGVAEQLNPAAAWNGQNWLVVWLSQEPTDFYYANRVMAARLSPQGTLLDAPIPLSEYGVEVGNFTVSSDGNQWVVVWEGSSADATELLGTRIAPDSTVLDPGGIQVLPGTYYNRSNLSMAFAGNEYLLTWQGINVVRGMRLNPDLSVIDAAPFNISPSGYSLFDSRVAANGTDFFVVWEAWISSNLFDGIQGARVSQAGQVLDPTGIAIWSDYGGYIGRSPRAAWGGSSWFVSFLLNGITVLRISPDGMVIDRNSMGADPANTSNKGSPESAPVAGGGIQLAWVDTRAAGEYPKDIDTARVSANRSFGQDVQVSNGLPSQIGPAVAANGSGYLIAFHDEVSGSSFVKAQLVDASGVSLWSEPVTLATSTSIQKVAAAWNGSLYLVAWSDRGSNQILGRRLLNDGTFVDRSPFVIMNGADPEVSVIGDLFLVIGANAPDNPQVRSLYAVRVQGSSGAVLDQPIQVGASFVRESDLAAFNNRWIAVWERHPTHDDPSARIIGNFINTDGTIGSEFVIGSAANVLYHYKPTVATDGTTALIAWQDPRVSNTDWNLYGRRVQADGTLLDTSDGIALVTAPNNQGQAAAAWDGIQFVLVYEDQRNNTLFFDPSTDIYATRVQASGSVSDPDGFEVFNDPMPSIFPDADGGNGQALLAASFYQNTAPFLAYRVGLRLLGESTVPPSPTPTSQPTGTAAPTATPLPSPTPSPVPPGCTSNCLRSTNLTLVSRGNGVAGQVTVTDENSGPVSGASVSITWSLPDGTAQTQSAATNHSGVASFSIKGGTGTYTLTITNIAKSGFTFDPDNSILSGSITR